MVTATSKSPLNLRKQHRLSMVRSPEKPSDLDLNVIISTASFDLFLLPSLSITHEVTKKFLPMSPLFAQSHTTLSNHLPSSPHSPPLPFSNQPSPGDRSAHEVWSEQVHGGSAEYPPTRAHPERPGYIRDRPQHPPTPATDLCSGRKGNGGAFGMIENVFSSATGTL